MASTLDWINLSLVPGLGLSGYWRLIEHFQSPAAVFRASEKELRQVEGIRERQVSGLFSATNRHNLGEQQLEGLAILGGVALSFEDEGYPPLLRQLVDPPPVLYILGRSEALVDPAVAIVGSRAATSYGRRTAFNLGRNLAGLAVTVISGLALGIDTESHRGALAGQGTTVAVLGCGLDVVYPRQNQSLYRQIAQRGALVSEYPLGTRPEGFRFPARNRIIAGLSQGVIVVEAAKRSGSLITAQMALDLGREVFAVPGQVDSCKSEGTHWLLQQGAKLVQRVEDIVIELDLSCSKGHEQIDIAADQDHVDIEPDALSLLACIEPYPLLREVLLEKSGLSPARVSELLLLLELDGLIEMLPGDQVRKISG
ncbi:DNA-processing protein DprA [Desulfocastanea catecholica]